MLNEGKTSNILGKRCLCKAYLKKVNDGSYIEIVSDKYEYGDGYILHSNNPEYEGVESPCEGDNDLPKTYYERTEKEFSGVIVGKKEVVLTGWLGVDTDYDFRGVEVQRIFRNTNEKVECYIVYFAEGRKRFVPVGDATILR